MKNKFLVWSTGLALFSMFFGSGNLVFPILVGKFTEGHFFFASLGLLLTGVLVPFLGILGMLLFKGDGDAFFERLGKPATFWFPLVALALMGPFGVLARCITVAHGAFRLLVADMPLWIFSLIGCALIFFLAIRKSRIMTILGIVLTPILLLALAAIAWFGIGAVPLPGTSMMTQWESFVEGLFQGYQTMDLLAAFFFSGFIIKHLQDKSGEPSLSLFLKSSFIGAGLLGAVYLILILLGAMYAPQLESVPAEEMLGLIATQALGASAAPVVCVAVVLACLTTAIVLTALFADFFGKRVLKGRLSSPWVLALTLLIAFGMSTLQFSGIAKVLGPILECIYPALIILTVLNIGFKLWGWKQVKMPTAIAVVCKLLTFKL